MLAGIYYIILLLRRRHFNQARAAALLLSATTARAETSIQPFIASKAIDLTHVMHDDMAFWPGGVPFKKGLLSKICGSLEAWVNCQVHDIGRFLRRDRCESRMNFS
jgi:hypothetical protein